MNWPKACANMVLIGGVVLVTLLLHNPKCLWALLFLIIWN